MAGSVIAPDSRAWAEVSLPAIRANAATLCALLHPETALMAVVKADAYGHGLLPVAQAAVAAGAVWLGVATVDEGAAIRAADIATPIALLCAQPPALADAILACRLTPLVGDRALLESLIAAARARAMAGVEIHLELETGMGRSGVVAEEAVRLWNDAQTAGFRVTGIATHFADADGCHPTLMDDQIAAFRAVRGRLEEAGGRFAWVHASNSAAMLRFTHTWGNLARPGLALYGIFPALPPDTPMPYPAAPPLQPALAVRARVGTVRDLPAGHTISYGATHVLIRPSRVATVLIGYGDGYPRRLSNRGWMLLRGQRAPILGRVCMDQTVVDVTDIPGVAAGDIATCLGTDGPERITVGQIATWVETTEHEITTCLTARLPRIYS